MAAHSETMVPAGGRFHGRTQRLFFPLMSVLMVITVLLGFTRTFFLAPLYRNHLPNLLVAVHGTVFFSWVVLFAVQVSLVETRRVNWHRRLGKLGAALLALMLAMGLAVILEGLWRGAGARGLNDSQILALNLFEMATAAFLLTRGLSLRRDTQAHKRLMLLGTASLLRPAVERWPFAIFQQKPPLVGLVLEVFVALTLGFDWMTRGRPHRTTALSGAAIFAVPMIAFPLAQTTFWQRLVAWLHQILTTVR